MLHSNLQKIPFKTSVKKTVKNTVEKNQGINVTGFTEIRDHNAACRNASVDATDFFLSWQP